MISAIYLNVQSACAVRSTASAIKVVQGSGSTSYASRYSASQINLRLSGTVSGNPTICVDVSGARAKGERGVGRRSWARGSKAAVPLPGDQGPPCRMERTGAEPALGSSPGASHSKLTPQAVAPPQPTPCSRALDLQHRRQAVRRRRLRLPHQHCVFAQGHGWPRQGQGRVLLYQLQLWLCRCGTFLRAEKGVLAQSCAARRRHCAPHGKRRLHAVHGPAGTRPSLTAASPTRPGGGGNTTTGGGGGTGGGGTGGGGTGGGGTGGGGTGGTGGGTGGTGGGTGLFTITLMNYGTSTILDRWAEVTSGRADSKGPGAGPTWLLPAPRLYLGGPAAPPARQQGPRPRRRPRPSIPRAARLLRRKPSGRASSRSTSRTSPRAAPTCLTATSPAVTTAPSTTSSSFSELPAREAARARARARFCAAGPLLLYPLPSARPSP
jgi:hypothetical protein